MHFLYILYSPKFNTYYVGETCDLQIRIAQHNNGTYKGSFTTRSNDWELKLAIPFCSIGNARRAEIFVKKMNSRTFVERLLKEHQWLIEKFDK